MLFKNTSLINRHSQIFEISINVYILYYMNHREFKVLKL